MGSQGDSVSGVGSQDLDREKLASSLCPEPAMTYGVGGWGIGGMGVGKCVGSFLRRFYLQKTPAPLKGESVNVRGPWVIV